MNLITSNKSEIITCKKWQMNHIGCLELISSNDSLRFKTNCSKDKNYI